MKFLKKITKTLQHKLDIGKSGQVRNIHTHNSWILTQTFQFIYFTPEFCTFYETHDYIHSILEKYNKILKNNPDLKLSDLIYDDLDVFTHELEYFVDLAYFNDGKYLVDFIVHNCTKPLYDQAILFNLLFKKKYLDLSTDLLIDIESYIRNGSGSTQRLLYYKIISQFFYHLSTFGEIDPTQIKETRDETFIESE